MGTYIIIILYNLLDAVKIPVIGQLKMSEMMALVLLPFFYRSNEFSRYPLLRKLAIAFLIVLFFQVITDVFVANTAFHDYIRGWSQTIIGLLSFIFLFRLLNGYQAITLFLLTSSVSTLIANPLGLEMTSDEMTLFKFRIAPMINQVVLVIAIFMYYKGKTKFIPLLFIAFGLFCIGMDARSKGLIMIFSAALLFAIDKGFKFRWAYVISISSILIVIFQTLYVFYVDAVLKGEIGGEHSMMQMERLENPYNPISLLMTGRGETFAAIEAIKDSPVFGHGSWAKDESLKYYRIIMEFQSLEFDETKAQIRQQLIPSHSVFMGAWVNYGVGAFLGIVYMFYLLMKMSVSLIKNGQNMPIFPVFITATINLVWAFMFSPFQQVRFSIPETAAILLTSYYLLKRNIEAESEDIDEDERLTINNKIKRAI